jgi:hypothetical protein
MCKTAFGGAKIRHVQNYWMRYVKKNRKSAKSGRFAGYNTGSYTG